MPKLYALRKIIRMKDGAEEVILPKTVFDGSVAEAKSFDELQAARPARADEVKSRDELQVAATEAEVAIMDKPPVEHSVAPDSGAIGDPKSAPKTVK